jgi:PPM family protein phosphatase
MTVTIHAACDLGCVRTNNEDMILVGDSYCRDGRLEIPELGLSDRPLAAAVADGMGGLEAGELASRFVLEKLHDLVGGLPEGLPDDELQTRFSAFASGTNARMPVNSGSTLAGFLLCSDRFVRYHAGDSRLWRYCDGLLERLTQDHSLREMGGNPAAPSNILINSIGGGASAFMDVAVLPKPRGGEWYLASSDGLHDLVSAAEIQAILRDGFDGAADRLVDAAKARGGKDNISVLLARVGAGAPA